CSSISGTSHYQCNPKKTIRRPMFNLAPRSVQRDVFTVPGTCSCKPSSSSILFNATALSELANQAPSPNSRSTTSRSSFIESCSWETSEFNPSLLYAVTERRMFFAPPLTARDPLSSPLSQVPSPPATCSQ